jgi:hypothetical protein
MSKYKILKQQYTPLDTLVPESMRDKVWVGKLNEEDTVDIFNFYSDAEVYKTNLENTDTSGRKYTIVEV